jgi:hypothetical protein
MDNKNSNPSGSTGKRNPKVDYLNKPLEPHEIPINPYSHAYFHRWYNPKWVKPSQSLLKPITDKEWETFVRMQDPKDVRQWRASFFYPDILETFSGSSDNPNVKLGYQPRDIYFKLPFFDPHDKNRTIYKDKYVVIQFKDPVVENRRKERIRRSMSFRDYDALRSNVNFKDPNLYYNPYTGKYQTKGPHNVTYKKPPAEEISRVTYPMEEKFGPDQITHVVTSDAHREQLMRKYYPHLFDEELAKKLYGPQPVPAYEPTKEEILAHELNSMQNIIQDNQFDNSYNTRIPDFAYPQMLINDVLQGYKKNTSGQIQPTTKPSVKNPQRLPEKPQTPIIANTTKPTTPKIDYNKLQSATGFNPFKSGIDYTKTAPDTIPQHSRTPESRFLAILNQGENPNDIKMFEKLYGKGTYKFYKDIVDELIKKA